MAKKIAGMFKMQLSAGEASMAPPVGPAFGQRGLNGMEFVKAFNGRTQKDKGTIVPILITFHTDKSFTFEVKTPPASFLLKKAAGIQSGSPESNKIKVATVTWKQCQEIAEAKMVDLNCDSVDSGAMMIKGTARSMGIEVDM
jgi:large subunit ribosomal protein L11